MKIGQTMPEILCVDASVVVKLFVPEPGSVDADRLVQQALSSEVILVAPSLMTVEVMSVLRKYARRGILTPEQADEAARALLDLPIEELSGRDLAARTWRIAQELDLPAAYDAAYLAAAEARGATLCTADQQLYRQAKGQWPVRLLSPGGAATV